MSIRVGIIGGAGYTGGELIRLLINHPSAELSFIHSRSNAGEPVYKVHKDLVGETEFKFTNTGEGPLIISSAQGSCGCTVPEYPNAPVAPGEEGAWEFTHLWHKLRPWPDSVEGIGMMKKKYVVATLSNGNVALLINMAKNSGIPWDHCFSGETFHHYKPDPEAYLGVVDSMYLKPHQVMLVAAHNNDLAAAQKCGLSTGFVIRPEEHGPGQKIDLNPTGEWDAVGNSIIDVAKKIGC